MRLGGLRRLLAGASPAAPRPRRKRKGLRKQADTVLERTDEVLEATQRVLSRAAETLARLRGRG